MVSTKFWRYGLVIHFSMVSMIVVLAYVGLIPTQYKIVPHADLVGHAILIGLLAFFLDGALHFRHVIPGKLAFLRLAPVIVLSLAGIEEMIQAFSPLRTASLSDFSADVVGVIVCSWLAKVVSKMKRRDFQNCLS